MCGRLTLGVDEEALAELMEEEGFPGLFTAWNREGAELSPRYNIAPTQAVLGVLADPAPRLTWLQWGLRPSWAAKGPRRTTPFQARAETVASKPMFAAAYTRRRCVLLVDGFYEWQPDPEGSLPYFFARPDGKPFPVAALWEAYVPFSPSASRLPRGGGGLGGMSEGLPTTALVTVPASADVDGVHDRMPAMVPGGSLATWLGQGSSDEALARLLKPAPAGTLCRHRVGREVNRAGVEGARLREPLSLSPGETLEHKIMPHAAPPAGTRRAFPQGSGGDQLTLW